MESDKEYIGKLSKHFPKITGKFLFFKHQIFSWKFFKILTVSNSYQNFGYRTGHFSEIRPHTGPDLMSGAALLSSIVFSINSQPFNFGRRRVYNITHFEEVNEFVYVGLVFLRITDR